MRHYSSLSSIYMPHSDYRLLESLVIEYLVYFEFKLFQKVVSIIKQFEIIINDFSHFQLLIFVLLDIITRTIN